MKPMSKLMILLQAPKKGKGGKADNPKEEKAEKKIDRSRAGAKKKMV